jgi:hypothetical protein
MDSVATYSEARNEYMKQLSTWIVPFMIQHYRTLWNNSSKGGPQRAMLVFQEKCAEVPKWNQDTIDENVGKLLDNCRCDYLEELMAAVFIAHTKVLIAIRVSSKHKKLQITLPKLDHFLHRIFSECARSFWKIPYLFLDDTKPIEMQKNMLQAEVLCSEAITSAVRSLLPIKNILAEYLSDDVMNPEPTIEEGDGSTKSPKRLPVEQAPSPVPVSAEPLKDEEEEETVAETPVEQATSVPEAVAVVEPKESMPAVDDIKKVVAEVKVVEAGEEIISLDDIMPAKEEAPAVVKPLVGGSEPEEITIDTEPASVSFSNYDHVFDERQEPVGSFKYAPKDLEPGEIPRLVINEEESSPLSLDSSVTPLEAPGVEADILADSILE